MAVTILEVLQSANYNLDNVKTLGIGFIPVVKSQLNNAIVLLEKGYTIHDLVEPLIEEFCGVNNVPDIS